MMTGHSTIIFDAILLYARAIRETCSQGYGECLHAIEEQERAALDNLLLAIRRALGDVHKGDQP